MGGAQKGEEIQAPQQAGSSRRVSVHGSEPSWHPSTLACPGTSLWLNLHTQVRSHVLPLLSNQDSETGVFRSQDSVTGVFKNQDSETGVFKSQATFIS